MTSKTFGVADYIVCAAMLLISVGIGVYYAYVDRKRQSTHEYMMAGKKMHFLPVAFSLLASFISAITLLGTPAEIYRYGTQYSLVCLAYFLIMPAAAHIFIPIFYRMNIVSAYQMIIYMAIVLYAPALALNAVTGLNWMLSATIIGISCTFYTTLGGMKAVLWTDTFQTLIMFGGVITVLVTGTVKVGGPAKVWEISDAGGRLEFFNLDFNPVTRHTFWTMSLGGWFAWLAVYGVNQAQVQRALSCRSLKHAQIAYWLNCFGLTFIVLLCCYTGLVIYAFYVTCDPQKAKQITKYDQLVPYFVMDILSEAPGIPGLFVASVFSGALSTISSGINSIAAVVHKDLIPHRWTKNLSEKADTRLSKVVALVFGIICLVLSMAVSVLGSGILQAALGLFGTVGGPFLGVFMLGVFHPWANSTGALVGLISSLVVTLVMNFGAIISDVQVKPLPLNMSGCEAANATFFAATTESFLTSTVGNTAPASEVFWLFRVSYMWYGFVGVSVVIVIGNLVSAFTGFNRGRRPDPRLLWPPLRYFCPSYFNTEDLHTSADADGKRDKMLQQQSTPLPRGVSSTAAMAVGVAADRLTHGVTEVPLIAFCPTEQSLATQPDGISTDDELSNDQTLIHISYHRLNDTNQETRL